MIPDLAAQVLAHKQRGIKVFPCHVSRASSLGHPCERFLVFEQLHWAKRAIPSLRQELIFDEGRWHEEKIIRDLQAAGVTVLEQARPFVLNGRDGRPLITGTIDGKVQVDGRAIPFEVKSMSLWTYQAVNTLEDMLKASAPWLRKYPAQLNLYLLMDGSEEGCFLLKNKQTGELKQIDVTLDLAYAEQLMQKAERIKDFVARREVPPPIPWDDDLCGRCDFLTICLPDQPAGPGLDLVDDPTLLDLLTRRADLQASHQEYTAVDQQLKKRLEGRENVVCGSWLIKGRHVTREGYAVQGGQYWKMTISKLDGASG